MTATDHLLTEISDILRQDGALPLRSKQFDIWNMAASALRLDEEM